MMGHKAGGKFTGKHTTIIDAADLVAGFAEKLPEVRKISLGVIQQIRKRKTGDRVVKIIDEGNATRLDITQSQTAQQMWVYSDDSHSTKLSIARFVRDNGYQLRFRKAADEQ